MYLTLAQDTTAVGTSRSGESDTSIAGRTFLCKTLCIENIMTTGTDSSLLIDGEFYMPDIVVGNPEQAPQ